MVKSYLSWLLATVLLFAAGAGGLHYYYAGNPHRVLIALDSSYGMKTRWHQVKPRLAEIAKKDRYAVYRLITEKNQVHDWNTAPRLGTTLTYGPRNLQLLLDTTRVKGFDIADDRLALTNDKQTAERLRQAGWQVMML